MSPRYPDSSLSIFTQFGFLAPTYLAGQMFEDELDLAYAVMDGVEARGQEGKYTTERFKFNSGASP